MRKKERIINQAVEALIGKEMMLTFGGNQYKESEVKQHLVELKTILNDVNPNDKFHIAFIYDPHVEENIVTIKKGRRYLCNDFSWVFSYSWGNCRQARSWDGAKDLVTEVLVRESNIQSDLYNKRRKAIVI